MSMRFELSLLDDGTTPRSSRDKDIPIPSGEQMPTKDSQTHVHGLLQKRPEITKWSTGSEGDQAQQNLCISS